ncbi:MAG: YfhO family protein, partial [Oscillospiraceae bacterium]
LLVDPVNLVWHAGSYQAFPSRYGFIPLFFALMLVSAAFQNTAPAKEPAKSKPEGIVLAAAGLALYFFFLLHILLFYSQQAGVYVYSLWGNTGSLAWALCCFALGGVLFFVLLAARAKKYLSKRVFALVLCCFVAVEGLYNGLLYMGTPANETESFSVAMDLAEKLPESTGRVKLSRKYTDANNIGAMGYASVAHYSSLTRWDYMVAMKKMGYSGYWMEMSGLGGTTLTDHFLGINTIICQRDGIDPNYSEENTVYQNNWYALVNNPLVPGNLSGMVLQTAPGAIATLPEGDRFYAQNWLYQNVYGSEGNLFKRYEPAQLQNVNYEYNQAEGEYFAYGTAGQAGIFVYQIQVGEAETLYFDCFRYLSSRLGEVVDDGFSISVNDIYIEGIYPNSNNNGLLNLGTFENQTVTVSIGLLRNEVMRSFGVYGVKQRQLEQAVQNATTVPLALQTGGLTASVQSEQGGLLVLPIAYDEGFTALVNGEKAPVYKVLDGFMAVSLQQGGNVVELKFLPRGFAPGAVTRLLLAAALLAAALRRAMQRLRGRPSAVAGGARILAGRLALVLLWAAFVAALAAVYILPIVLWFGGERILVF